VRDYEVVKVEQDVPNEFLLVFDDSEVAASPTTSNDGLVKDGETRRPGAYYKLIERKMLLKKKRTEVCFSPYHRTGICSNLHCGAARSLSSSFY
jgi:RNA polymerase II-associated factor 1